MSYSQATLLRSLARTSETLAAKISTVTECFCAVLLAGMTLTVLLGVFFRYVLAAPLPWYEELAMLFMVWTVFLGSSVALHRAEHVAIDFFLERLPKAIVSIVDLTYRVAALTLLVVVIVYGWQLVATVGRLARYPGLRLSEIWLYSAVPLGATLMIIELLLGTLSRWLPTVVGERMDVSRRFAG